MRFPGLTIVSMGAVSKVATPTKAEDIRLVMDGTNGVELNPRTRQRDQDRCPTAADVKRHQRAQAKERRRPLGLAVDVQEAHRIPPTHPEDWRHQGARSSEAANVYIYMYNVFGYSCSAYWWARLGGALVRAVHLVAAPSFCLWLLLMADDLKVESTSEHRERDVVWMILFWAMLGVPLAWKKT